MKKIKKIFYVCFLALFMVMLGSCKEDEEAVVIDNIVYVINEEGDAYGVNNIKNMEVESITIKCLIEGLPVVRIEDFAFEDCSSLTSVIIPYTVTSIGKAAFANCSSLKSITIPIGVTSIDFHAFVGCTSLNTVYYEGTYNDWKHIYMGEFNQCLTNANIIYNCK